MTQDNLAHKQTCVTVLRPLKSDQKQNISDQSGSGSWRRTLTVPDNCFRFLLFDNSLGLGYITLYILLSVECDSRIRFRGSSVPVYGEFVVRRVR